MSVAIALVKICWHNTCFSIFVSDFQTFLKQLTVVLKFTALSADKHGACLVVMKKNNVPILFEYDGHLVPNSILLSTPIVEIAEANARAFYRKTLESNHKMEETLSLKPDERLIYLHRRVSPEIDAKELKPLIDHFLTSTLHWKEVFEELVQQAPDDKGPSSPPKPYRFKV